MTTVNLTNTTSRQQQLMLWVQNALGQQDVVLNSLPGDASSRQYHRVQLGEDKSASARYIVMDAADEQEAMAQFITVATLMAPAINVPDILGQDLANGFLLLQDFGAVEFAHLLVDEPAETIDAHYQSAMQTLIELQRISVDTASKTYKIPLYDAAILDREMDLFSEWFIPYIGAALDTTLWHNSKTALINAILAQPQVVVHRDYHSRNLMQDQADTSRLGVIDFQDALIGAYSYDLVSLVRDAYVDWPDMQVTKWIHDFWHRQQQAGLEHASSAAQFENDVNIMGVQRHLKVLGIFIRLSKRDGKDRYLADIPKVMRDLLLELDWLGVHGSEDIKSAVLPFNEWLRTIVLPAYQNVFLK